MKAAGLGLLLGWYFTQGKSQAKYVKDAFPEGYLKKSWGCAAWGIGVGAASMYIVAVLCIVMAGYSPDPNELAAEVKPMILQQWQNRPELRGATIQNVTLVHKHGKVYAGFVDATMGGQSERLALEVVYDRGSILWELKP